MKIMITGSDHVWAIEKIYLHWLKEEQIDARLFPAQNYFYQYYNRSLINKIRFKLKMSGIIRHINKLFREAVTKERPSVIWVFKGMEILPESLRWASAQGIKLVNYNPDSPFIFSGSGSGNKNVTDSIALFDLHFTYSYSIKEKLEQDYSARVALLPFGFELSTAQFEQARLQPEVVKLCFVGNPDTARAKALMALAGQGIEIDVYGHHWPSFISHPSIRLFDAVYDQELWNVLRRYRVQLNLMRAHNELSHNMRSFEVPAIGGIMLAPDTKEHRLFFQDGKEVFLYGSLEQCGKLVNKILSMPPQTADQIRSNARMRSLQSGYSYQQRTRSAIGEITQLFS